MTAPRATRGRLTAVLVVAVLTLLLAEGFVRARTSAVPLPQHWVGPEMPLKEQQIDALAGRGGASVVFLGSSVIDASIDASAVPPASSGRPSYNAGTGAGSLPMIDTWARLFAIPKLTPDVVVVGLVSRELNANDPEQAKNTRAFYASTEVRHLEGKDDLVDQLGRKLESVSELFKYRTVLRDPDNIERLFGIGNLEVGTTYGDVVADDGQFQGFLQNRYVDSAKLDANLLARGLHDFVIGDAQVAALRRLLTYLHEHVQHVVLVNMPTTARYVALHPHGKADYDASTQVMKREAASAGVTFIDEGVWTDDLFADLAHLNGKGSQQLTSALDAEIQKLR